MTYTYAELARKLGSIQRVHHTIIPGNPDPSDATHVWYNDDGDCVTVDDRGSVPLSEKSISHILRQLRIDRDDFDHMP